METKFDHEKFDVCRVALKLLSKMVDQSEDRRKVGEGQESYRFNTEDDHEDEDDHEGWAADDHENE